MTLRPGEVVLIRIEFHQRSGGKLRPAVVLLDTADEDFIAAPITAHSRVSDFSKELENHRAAVALHCGFYNFCQLHGSLRVTPAMEAGITDHVWDVKEVLAYKSRRAPNFGVQ